LNSTEIRCNGATSISIKWGFAFGPATGNEVWTSKGYDLTDVVMRCLREMLVRAPDDASGCRSLVPATGPKICEG
jgi:hypothetical protein